MSILYTLSLPLIGLAWNGQEQTRNERQIGMVFQKICCEELAS